MEGGQRLAQGYVSTCQDGRKARCLQEVYMVFKGLYGVYVVCVYVQERWYRCCLVQSMCAPCTRTNPQTSE